MRPCKCPEVVCMAEVTSRTCTHTFGEGALAETRLYRTDREQTCMHISFVHTLYVLSRKSQPRVSCQAHAGPSGANSCLDLLLFPCVTLPYHQYIYCGDLTLRSDILVLSEQKKRGATNTNTHMVLSWSDCSCSLFICMRPSLLFYPSSWFLDPRP